MYTGQQYNPQALRVVPADHVTQHGYSLVHMPPHQSTPTEHSYYEGINYHATAGAPLGGIRIYMHVAFKYISTTFIARLLLPLQVIYHFPKGKELRLVYPQHPLIILLLYLSLKLQQVCQ